MDVLVGSTGFVGSNLLSSRSFDLSVHSTNVNKAYGSCPDLLVYAGVTGTYFLANKNPEADMEIIESAIYNIRKINPNKLVLISTINVYEDSKQKTEDDIPARGLGAYGNHRLELENRVRDEFTDCLIVRLPAIYGKGLKKNFIHDLIDPTPPMLSAEKYYELIQLSPIVSNSYFLDISGFYSLKKLVHADHVKLSRWFAQQSFNAVSFTDSRSTFQFYDLSRLWNDIQTFIDSDIGLLNIAVPPISSQKVVQSVFGKQWTNIIPGEPFEYDMRTKFDYMFGRDDGYIMSEGDELSKLVDFVLRKRAKTGNVDRGPE